MKRRRCPACEFEWDSETVVGKGVYTVCPGCGAPVPGDSMGTEK